MKMICNFTKNVALPQTLLMHFAKINYLYGFSINWPSDRKELKDDFNQSVSKKCLRKSVLNLLIKILKNSCDEAEF